MMLFPQSSTGMAEEEAEKEISKRKKILRKFLLERGELVKLSDIVPTGSWHLGEFNVGKRIYHVDDIREIIYGDDWFKYHEYKDYGKFRVSISYHFFGLSNPCRSLTISCENAYNWRPRTAYYKKMTEKQMDKIVKSYVEEYIKAGSPGGANPDILASTIKLELSKAYLKRWYDK